ncbi:MAG: hypothetical protein Q7T16_03430 [Candidatus Burarchaeum sp.]|nr:hypothetical protein [Candidatus Burarchaeum sp.]MDO8339683.1 hypothetical protein [Candidatus Burarchaeum sp.]
MKILAAIALLLIVLAAGCTAPWNKSLPAPSGGENESEIVPVAPEPVVEPVLPPFDPASLCGGTFGNYVAKVYSVRPCGQGDYIIHRECCGIDPVAYVNAKGQERSVSDEVRAACRLAGDNICVKVMGSEPIACPAAEVKACANYSAPVCARIVNKSGTGWFDFENNCQACLLGKRMGNETAYIDGTCSSNKIKSRMDIETEQWNNIYQDLIGKEILMYAQHYGLAGRLVTITVTKEDIQSIERREYDGQPAWFVTITRVMEDIPRTLQLYYSEDGSRMLEKVQTQ